MRNLGRDPRHNPLPLALIGAGIAWLMMTSGRRHGFDAAYQGGVSEGGGSFGDETSVVPAPVR